MPPRILAIIQARYSSSRLPGKVLVEIAGQPMLARVVDRARGARTLAGVVVATTIDPTDDPVERLCRERAIPCYRGSLYDVLDRYYQAALRFEAEVIVRLTADCPVIDPGLIDETVQAFLGLSPTGEEELGLPPTPLTSEGGNALNPSPGNPFDSAQGRPFDSAQGRPLDVAQGRPFDFAANRLPPPWGRTYPIGLDTEVCTFSALERAWREADQPYQREHVMPYLYEDVRSRHYFSLAERLQDRSLPEGFFSVLHLQHEPDYGHLRWTVDTPADLELIRQVYARFPGRDDFSWKEILDLIKREPSLAEINARVQHKSYQDVDERKTV